MEKILLIEDNREILDNMTEILELANYQVLTASNGKEGVAMALEHKPDLIICDIMMPVLDGFGVLHLLHKNETLQRTPFIFITARTDRNEQRKGMEQGADDYITKPFEGTELLNAVASRLKRSAELRQDKGSSTSQLLRHLTEKEIFDSLKNNKPTSHFKKKQQIYAEGNKPQFLYYITQGKVKTSKRNEEGKELIIGLYNEGDFFGYQAMLQEGAYQEDAEAMDDTAVLLIPQQDFELLINQHPPVMRKFVQLLAKSTAEREQQLIGIAYNSLRKKVAEALLLLDKKFNGTGNDYTLHVSRDNLAAMAGVAKESLIRTLGDFRNESLIQLKEGDIIITDRDKLAAIIS
ncbi:CRP-like cAMP-binding protein [Chitinophaga dinghuensis]|uniref:CRP-like cAMP-binding protein n=1 Tax=Chitinophaga dinghuensis TaxID=1539050 RepID=A0A327WCI1_9BACT|nr:response regulator [Chitinophaga dinghuensis]RAJ87929.1 CRP-like cAMP-binding protein [Chitinophaga dinghuensis]